MNNPLTAWAAGLFEGEGTFSIRHDKANWRAMLEMQMTTTDLDVLERFAFIVSCGNIHSRKIKDERKPQWTWSVSGAKALSLAQRFEPHLGRRRRARLAEITARIHDSQPKPRSCECCATTFNPTRFNRERFCSHECRYRSKYLRRKYGTTSLQTAINHGYCPGHIRDTDPIGTLIRRQP